MLTTTNCQIKIKFIISSALQWTKSKSTIIQNTVQKKPYQPHEVRCQNTSKNLLDLSGWHWKYVNIIDIRAWFLKQLWTLRKGLHSDVQSKIKQKW